MLPARTPELVELLTPALNAARNAAQTMESARDTGDRADREFAFEVRSTYESLRDDVLKKLDMSSIRSLFLSADAAIESGDISAIDLLRDTWGIATHPFVERLREVDSSICSLETELDELRNMRAELTARALNSGITQYRLSQSLNRSESSIHTWRKSYYRNLRRQG